MHTDPLVGRGTTTYYCDRLGRSVVGIDESQHYFDKIREERVQQANVARSGAIAQIHVTSALGETHDAGRCDVSGGLGGVASTKNRIIWWQRNSRG